MRSKKQTVGTSRANRKNVPNAVKDKKLLKGDHCGQQSGDVAVVMWLDKK
jgi:hypothetical protein